MSLSSEHAFAPRDATTTSSALAHDLVAEHARRAPRATALRLGEEQLSYEELIGRAGALAQHLARRGVGSQDRVVVALEPSMEVVIALLGILAAGAVYVPLDPGYPRARVEAILADVDPALVVTSPPLVDRLPLSSRAVLTLEQVPASSTQAWPRLPLRREQPAYVFYTSGTTGTPKGVVATHENLLHYLSSIRERYRLGRTDVVPSIARHSFSISLFELLAPLTAGASVLLLPREHVLQPAKLAAALEQVTFFHAGPSLLRTLLAYLRERPGGPARLTQVRHASTGGDMVPPDVLEGMKQTFPNAEVFVIYGASELSCMACTYPVPRDRQVTRTFVGQPFPDVTLRLVSESGQEAAPGEPGEIWIGGSGVVSGYLRRPELTTEKFVRVDSQRFYRTGDIGRLSADGWLEMLGRSDFQVKIRGMRVELNDVEQALRRAPGVRDAAASAHEDESGERQLVGYVVTEPRADEAAHLAEIRRFVSELVPDYMVPTRWLRLDQLPLNHNLKLDRRALPAPPRREASGGTAPATVTEQLLAELWQEILNLPQVSRDDNFFELGGHSLLAMTLSARSERRLGVSVDGMTLLREPLALVAADCDRRLGRASPPLGAIAAQRASQVPSIFHFGKERDLYGVLHGEGPAEHAALLVGPVGQEQVRARFVLTQLAKRLASAGVPTLGFDFFGCGDSGGESRAVSPKRWQRDIADAHAELSARTGARRVTAVGVRLGALLLAAAALSFDRLVLWDAVESGAQHLAELSRLQREYLLSIAPHGWLNFRPPRARPGELLGLIYSEAAQGELGTLRLETALARQRSPAHHLHFDCSWSDISALEDVIADRHISSELARLVQGTP